MGLIKVALILVIFTTLAYFVLPGNAANAEMAKSDGEMAKVKSDLVSPIYIQDLNADEHKMKKFRGYGGGGGYGGYGYGHGYGYGGGGGGYGGEGGGGGGGGSSEEGR